MQTSLTPAQYELLVETIVDFIGVYRTCDYRALTHFVGKRKGELSSVVDTFSEAPLVQQPLGKVPFHISIEESARDKDGRIGKQRAKDMFRGWRWPPRSREELFRAHWHSAYYVSACWVGIDPSDADITVFEDNTDGLSEAHPSSRIGEPEHHFGQDAVSFGGPGYVVFPKPQRKKCKYARLAFVAQHPHPDPPWPRVIWFRWVPSARNWIPHSWKSLYGSEGAKTYTQLIM